MTPSEAIQHMEFSLTEEATEESLKQQFKRLVLKYHPDRNKSPGATEKFIKIKEAYEVLKKVMKEKRVVRQPRSQQFNFGESVTVIFNMNDGFTMGTGPTMQTRWNQ